jgi:hypothetical protein
MNVKLCSKCDVEIPLKRVKMGYLDCVKCSDVESYGFVNIINHKTGNTVQPMPKKQADAINKFGDRKRFGTVLKGGSKSYTYNPKKTYSAPSLAQIGSPKLFEKVGEEAMYLLENNGFDTASLYIDKEVEKYNISSSQAFRLRQILQVFAQ